MKRIILFSMVFALLFSLLGCKTADYQDTAEVDTLVADKRDEQPTEQPTEPLPETEEKNDPTIAEQPDTEDKDDEPEQDSNNEVDPSVFYKPLKYTIDDKFSPYEVVVTLTAEESVLNNLYTADSFKNVDVFYVYRYDSYHCVDFFPQLKKNTTLFLMLNEPSKEKVLEYCDILEKDERVLFARPNPYDYAAYGENGEYCAFEVTLSGTVTVTSPVYKTNFSNLGDFSVESLLSTEIEREILLDEDYVGGLIRQVVFKFKGGGYDFIKEKLLLIAENDKVDQARPMIDKKAFGSVIVEITQERASDSKEITKDEFPGIDIINSISFPDHKNKDNPIIYLNFYTSKEKDHKKLSAQFALLKKNPIVKKLYDGPFYEISTDTHENANMNNSYYFMMD